MTAAPALTILYFADIRFPLERANGIQTAETCHALARRGHHVALVVRPDTQDPPRDPFAFYGLPAIAGFQIERAPVTGPDIARRAGYLAFATGRAMGAGRADALFTRDLGLAAALLRIPRTLRAPVIYESHGYAPEVARALPQLVATASVPSERKLARLARREALVWRRADGYVTITEGLASELRERLGSRADVAVVPDGVRLPSEGPGTVARSARQDAPPVVAYSGHLYAWKGVDILLDAIARLPGVRGLVIGGHEREPDLARVRALADALGIADRVQFTGLVPPSQVAGLLRAADVLVLPNPASAISTRFTSPLKLFEYMAAGRPIVATDLPALREVLRDGQTAVLVTPGDASALAAGIERVVTDARLAERLATAARTAVDDYTWDRRAERLERLLAGLAGPRR
jgi:glycosyltransferase involved in cell wall biosynthesis